MSEEDGDGLAATNKGLREVLRKSLANQHEAMQRVLLLHARNLELEKAARERDAAAVALEAKCNTAVREQARWVLQQQEWLETVIQRMLVLENETLQIATDNKRLVNELKQSRKDRQRLQEILDQCHQEKKQLVRELARHAAERHGLELEIDRLIGENAKLKTRVTELEGRLCNSRN